MSKSLIEMASGIIAAQARNTLLSPEDLAVGMRKVFALLQQLQRLETEMSSLSDGTVSGTLAPQDSLQHHRVICLECYQEFKLLSNRHLALHGMNAREYKLKYGFPLRQALSAGSLTLSRRQIAKDKGVGAKLVAYRRQQA